MAVVQQGSGAVTERLVERASAALEARTSRRGLLARAALVGSALSVGPLRYLLQPTTAWGVIGRAGFSGDGRSGRQSMRSVQRCIAPGE